MMAESTAHAWCASAPHVSSVSLGPHVPLRPAGASTRSGDPLTPSRRNRRHDAGREHQGATVEEGETPGRRASRAACRRCPARVNGATPHRSAIGMKPSPPRTHRRTMFQRGMRQNRGTGGASRSRLAPRPAGSARTRRRRRQLPRDVRDASTHARSPIPPSQPCRHALPAASGTPTMPPRTAVEGARGPPGSRRCGGRGARSGGYPNGGRGASPSAKDSTSGQLSPRLNRAPPGQRHHQKCAVSPRSGRWRPPARRCRGSFCRIPD